MDSIDRNKAEIRLLNAKAEAIELDNIYKRARLPRKTAKKDWKADSEGGTTDECK